MDQGSFLDAIIWFVMLTILFYLNREIEIMRLVSEIERYLRLYKATRDKALNATLSGFKALVARQEKGKVDVKKLEDKVNALIEFALIIPVSLDPYGIVRKLKHLLLSSEEALKDELRRLAPKATDAEIENLLNMLGATRLLNQIYKAVDHIYRIGRKFKSIWILMQLNAQLPFVTEEVRALEGAVEAFSKGLPIGDSVGPIVAAKLLHEYNALKVIEPVEHTVVGGFEFEGREVIVIKAKGPGGSTGRIDDALRWVLNRYKADVNAIITVDAALKLEGEESGMVVEGFGVAMGGLGVERFNIEKIATEYGIPLYAVLIKMSEEEAFSVVDEKLYDSVDKAISIIKRTIEDRIPEGGRVIVIGVGNTVGVYP